MKWSGRALLITSFSGLIHYKSIFKGKLKRLAIISTVTLVTLFTLLYFIMIFSVDNIISMIVFFYMICIVIMTLGTFFNLGYTERNIKFRIMLCVGGTSFLISDAFVGINMFNSPNPITGVWVLLTYNIAIFCLQYAVLFLHKKKWIKSSNLLSISLKIKHYSLQSWGKFLHSS